MAKVREIRTVSEEYEKIAEEILEKSPEVQDIAPFIKNQHISVIYLESNKKKESAMRGLIYADCEKIPDSKRWAIDADFVICVYKPNVERFTKDQLKVLLLHELCHIGVETTDKGTIRKFIWPHTIQDFDFILKKYGLTWQRNEQLEFSFD